MHLKARCNSKQWAPQGHISADLKAGLLLTSAEWTSSNIHTWQTCVSDCEKMVLWSIYESGNTLPHHVLSALVNFIDEKRHQKQRLSNQWILDTSYPRSSVSSRTLFSGTFNPPLPVCLLLLETEVDPNKSQASTFWRRKFFWEPYLSLDRRKLPGRG